MKFEGSRKKKETWQDLFLGELEASYFEQLNSFSDKRVSEKTLILATLRLDILSCRAAGLPEFYSERVNTQVEEIFGKSPDQEDAAVLALSRIVINTALEKEMRGLGRVDFGHISFAEEEEVFKLAEKAFWAEQWNKSFKNTLKRNADLKMQSFSWEAEAKADLFLDRNHLSSYIAQVIDLRKEKEFRGRRIPDKKHWDCLKAGVHLFSAVPQSVRRQVGEGVRMKVEKAWDAEIRKNEERKEFFAEELLSSDAMKGFDGAVSSILRKETLPSSNQDYKKAVEIFSAVQAAVSGLDEEKRALAEEGLRTKIKRIIREKHAEDLSSTKKALALLDPEKTADFFLAFKRMASHRRLPEADKKDRPFEAVRSAYEAVLGVVPEAHRQQAGDALLSKAGELVRGRLMSKISSRRRSYRFS